TQHYLATTDVSERETTTPDPPASDLPVSDPPSPDLPDSENKEEQETELTDDLLLDRLKTWRTKEAENSGVSPSHVLHDATLETLARDVPDTLPGLKTIKGIGDKKIERYGEQLLAILHGSDSEDSGTAKSEDKANAEKKPKSTAKTNTEDNAKPEPKPKSTAKANDSSEAESVSPPKAENKKNSAESQPSHYWTWRLLADGFTAEECQVIRGLASETIVDHAIQSLDCGRPVDLRWFFTPELISILTKEIGPGQPEQINPLLARLPQGFRHDQVRLFLRCREHQGDG
ncbi:MAG: HRDC domain-containing protein, partial [Planctomycetales bacterium]